MTPDEKGTNLFFAAISLTETWKEIDRLAVLIDQKLVEEFKDSEFVPKRHGKGVRPEGQEDVLWQFQYKFNVHRKRRGRPKLAVHLNYQFRLCWGPDSKVVRSDGSEAQIPIVVITGCSDESLDDLDVVYPFGSPTEREEPTEYRIVNRFVWRGDVDESYWGWAYAVPLCSIESPVQVATELIVPLKELFKARPDSDPEQLEKAAFADTKHVLRWLDVDGRLVLG